MISLSNFCKSHMHSFFEKNDENENRQSFEILDNDLSFEKNAIPDILLSQYVSQREMSIGDPTEMAQWTIIQLMGWIHNYGLPALKSKPELLAEIQSKEECEKYMLEEKSNIMIRNDEQRIVHQTRFQSLTDEYKKLERRYSIVKRDKEMLIDAQQKYALERERYVYDLEISKEDIQELEHAKQFLKEKNAKLMVENRNAIIKQERIVIEMDSNDMKSILKSSDDDTHPLEMKLFDADVDSSDIVSNSSEKRFVSDLALKNNELEEENYHLKTENDRLKTDDNMCVNANQPSVLTPAKESLKTLDYEIYDSDTNVINMFDIPACAVSSRNVNPTFVSNSSSSVDVYGGYKYYNEDSYADDSVSMVGNDIYLGKLENSINNMFGFVCYNFLFYLF